MCGFTFAGLSDGASPDRLDALVWSASALIVRNWNGPRIRSTWDGPVTPLWRR